MAIVGALDTAFDPHDPPQLDEVLGAAFDTVQRIDAEQDVAKLALQVWGEAMRSPVLAETLTREIARIRASLTRLVEAYQAQGRMPGDVPAGHVARVLTGLLPGFALQHALLGDVDAADFRAGLRALLSGGRAAGSMATIPPPAGSA